MFPLSYFSYLHTTVIWSVEIGLGLALGLVMTVQILTVNILTVQISTSNHHKVSIVGSMHNYTSVLSSYRLNFTERPK